MTRVDSIIDIDAFEAYANVIKLQHKEMLEARKSYIKAMYKILRKSGYTKIAAVNTIHLTLCEKLNSLIEVRKGFIEDSIKGVK